MKIKTLFFTSILAAAAMSAVPAWAATVTTYVWSGNKTGTWDYSSKKWRYYNGSSTSDIAFVKDNSAVFSVKTDTTVTIGADISAYSASLQEGTLTLKRAATAQSSYKVTISESSNNFIVGSSTAKSTATLKYGAEDMIAGTVKVYSSGTLDLDGYSADSASISVEKNGTLKLSVNTDGTATAKAVSFAEGAQLVLDLSNASIESGTTLSILSSSSSSIQYNGNALDASDVEALASGSVFGNYSDWKREWSVEKTTTGSTLKLKLTDTSAVPEPSMFGLLAGAGALAFVAARRRRRAK